MSNSGDSGPGRREVAYRLFAAEFEDCSLSYSESDEERAPNYVVTPTGLRVNRLFAVGVLTETEAVNEETLRGRIVDPTGGFVTYAGQYQPPAQAFLDRTTPPAFVAITGKARTFEPEDSDRVFTSIRPESLSEVEASTRDRWVVSAAESTLERIAVCAAALDSGLRGDDLEAALSEAGVDDSLAAGVPRAIEHYGTTTTYLAALRQLAIDALEVIADEREEVRSLETAPEEGGDAEIGSLPAADIDLSAEPATEPTDPEMTVDEEPSAPASSEPADEPTVSADSTDSTLETTAEPETTESTSETTTELGGESDAETDLTGGAETPSDSTAAAIEETTDGSTPADSAVDTDTDPAGDLDTAVDSDSTVDTDTDPTGETDSIVDPEPASEIESADADEVGMYQLDDEEREELESEFGSEFSSGNEVDPAGEAGIDIPDVDELAEKAEAEESTTAETAAIDESTTADSDETAEPDDSETLGEFEDDLGEFEDTDSKTDEAATAESTTASDESAETVDTEPAGGDADDTPADDSEPAEAIDLEEAVVEVMDKLDDGDGVDRAVLVTEVVDTYGVDETAIEEAIADALMGGRCYEPSDDLLKAI